MKEYKYSILSIDSDGIALVTPCPSLSLAQKFVRELREFFSEDCRFYVICEEVKEL